MALSAARLVWNLRRGAQTLGWPGMLGVALLVSAVALKGIATPIAARAGADSRTEAERLQSHYGAAVSAPQVKTGPTQQLETFYAFFPEPATLSQWLLLIYAAAEKQGVALEAGDYKMVQEKGRRLARYQIVLPVKGSYQEIRGFMSTVLNEVPNAAFEDIALQRESIASAALDARLTLTLFVRMEQE